MSNRGSSGQNMDEETPLLEQERTQKAGTTFRRVSLAAGRGQRRTMAAARGQRRTSVRGTIAFPFFPSLAQSQNEPKPIEPAEALSPLVTGGFIRGVEGVFVHPRPPSLWKSIPAYYPYRRKDRHRSFYLFWLNEFRHWFKSSRLLVRLAGLDTLAREVWNSMVKLEPTSKKFLHKASKFYKHLAQGGPMHGFLQRVHPFTRTLRVVVGFWRWLESAKCRRLEVGVEETMVCVARILFAFEYIL